MKNYPTKEQILEYLKDDGAALVWVKSPRNSRDRIGEVAGHVNNKGIHITNLFGKRWVTSRLLWIIRNGPIPDGIEIDHIDGDPSNNATRNLRLATRSQNKMNRRTGRNNSSGVKGVHLESSTNKWVASVWVNRRPKFVGKFKNLEEAKLAVESTRASMHGEFCNHGDQ